MNTRTILCLVPLAILCGCVHAGKRTTARHELWRFDAGKVVSHEIWEDNSRGGGTALLADPQASGLVSTHQNQVALGGGSALELGKISGEVRADAITATGQAAGNVIGATLKTIAP